MRKVKFYLSNIPHIMRDHTNKEQFKERIGFFHTCGNDKYENDNTTIAVIAGIVEEIDTGKIFLINPENITFLSE